MPFVKLLHAFQKRKELEGVLSRQSVPIQLGYALALLREVVSTQPDMPSDHADIVGKRHQGQRPRVRDVPRSAAKSWNKAATAVFLHSGGSQYGRRQEQA
ncbi:MULTISPECIES: hypothetical protein [unclassified Mesorhizobium]|uniref:hypothetical protein n=1 Tax=unclassified Mesorhizobium TaxID=325217 RepID=UPI000F75D843|nr:MULTISPECIES: hypothetical protein [unclassified Mesorhizobium]AZO61798.1 hypothetical protein EJ078_22925 [Mesorhizobium sp. M1A.F.Ca.IN.022.06.1.1]MCT2580611.1 hypothetical protein [Mesorhizobium sp. P13.3]MDF3169553.1 hypothetical protein [Mesorhizobium sp. P16.1]MDF3178784.1 hypothetical protein [Mesorhizobium sp. P17.1]MDF3186468.1 hypothetical protein [Mesorhizobium sp. ICCV3110.1]